MFAKTLSLAIVATLAAAAPAHAAGDDTTQLVQKVRAEAAWQGVEVNRIQRADQKLNVKGFDRQGRAVTLVMHCDSLGFVCAPKAGGSFVAIAR